MDLGNTRVLMTGGAGFVGYHLTRALLGEGADVHILDNLFAGREGHVPKEATFQNIDLRSDDLDEAVKSYNPEVVIHLAALHYIPYCEENPGEAYDVNVNGTRNLYTTVRDIEATEIVIYTSSAAVYPPRSGPLKENSRVNPIDIYGKSKLIGEDLTELLTETSDIRAVSTRLFNIYGEQETNPHLIPAILDQIADGGTQVELGNLKPKRDFVHVTDVSRAIVAIADKFKDDYRVFNVGTGGAYSVREVFELVNTSVGGTLELQQNEERMRESDRPHLQADISRIQTEIGWEPEVSLAEGLEELVSNKR